MTPAEFEAAMRLCFSRRSTMSPGHPDTERGHQEADSLMCEVLKGLGYGRGIDFYLTQERWYS